MGANKSRRGKEVGCSKYNKLYANPEGVRSMESEGFYREIGDDVSRFRDKGFEVIVMGDFNAQYWFR